MRSTAGLLLVFTGWLSTARATPLVVSHAGQLLDGSDHPVEATALPVGFALYGAAASGSPLWSGTCPVDVRAGRFSVLLGSQSCPGSVPLDSALWADGTSRYLQISVGSVDLLPRLALGVVPLANQAAHAATADHALVSDFATNASHAATADLAVNTTQFGGRPASDYALAASTVGGVTVSAPLVNQGTTTAPQLALTAASATSGGYVSAADWTRFDSAASRSLTLAVAAPLSSTGGSSPTLSLSTGGIGATLLATDAQSLAKVSNNRLSVDGAGDVVVTGGLRSGGLLQVGASTVACSVGLAGSLRYDATKQRIELCNGGSWLPMQAIATGETAGTAGQSCLALKQNGVSVSGVYWIDPDGSVSTISPVKTYCDMTTDGGGWTLVASNSRADTTIASGTGRNNASYELTSTITGISSNPGTATDYIIGPAINGLTYTEGRVWSVASSGGHVLDYRWPVTNREAVAGGSSKTFLPNNNVTDNGCGNSGYLVLDGVYADRRGNGSYDANSNQSTVGGAGVAGSSGDPVTGTYYGHGSSEGSFEGFYTNRGGGCGAFDSDTYTTWVR